MRQPLLFGVAGSMVFEGRRGTAAYTGAWRLVRARTGPCRTVFKWPAEGVFGLNYFSVTFEKFLMEI